MTKYIRMNQVHQLRIFMRARTKLNMVMFSIYTMLIEINFKTTTSQPLNKIFFSRPVGPSHLHGPLFGAITFLSFLVTFSLKKNVPLGTKKA
jgi:hypothetical protein